MELCWSNMVLFAFKFSSNYLLVTVTITIASVLFIWAYEKPRFYKLIFNRNTAVSLVNHASSEVEMSTEILDGEEEADVNLNTARQQLIEQMTADMTKEQLEAEKEAERVQLQAIFKLLQEQEEKFNVSSIEQLQEQLSLYR